MQETLQKISKPLDYKYPRFPHDLNKLFFNVPFDNPEFYQLKMIQFNPN